jgi:hypothetical protein
VGLNSRQRIFDESLQKEIAEIDALLDPPAQRFRSEYTDQFRAPLERKKSGGIDAKLKQLAAQIAQLEPLVEFEKDCNRQQMHEIEELRRICLN